MAVLTPSNLTGGLELQSAALTAANAGGDSFPNNGHVGLLVENTSGGSLSVVAAAPNPDNFGVVAAAHDRTMTVAAGKTILFPPFSESQFNDSNGRVQLTYPGGVTGLKVRPIYV